MSAKKGKGNESPLGLPKHLPKKSPDFYCIPTYGILANRARFVQLTGQRNVMLLAQEVRKSRKNREGYVEFANFLHKQGGKIILDNGAYEGEQVSNTELFNLARDLRVDSLVVPDVIGSREGTIVAITTFLDLYFRRGMENSIDDIKNHTEWGLPYLILCPHGKNFEDLLKSTEEILTIIERQNKMGEKFMLGWGRVYEKFLKVEDRKKHIISEDIRHSLYRRIEKKLGTRLTECRKHLLGAQNKDPYYAPHYEPHIRNSATGYYGEDENWSGFDTFKPTRLAYGSHFPDENTLEKESKYDFKDYLHFSEPIFLTTVKIMKERLFNHRLDTPRRQRICSYE